MGDETKSAARGKPCRKCKEPVFEKTNACPNCNAVNPEMSVGQLWLGSIMLLILTGVIFRACSSYSGSKSSFSELEIQKGVHCLISWDGSHHKFKQEVKNRMRDPKSFEHVETRLTPRRINGQHIIYMDYRAKNGFGGVNSETATGTVDNATCDHKLIATQ